MSHLVSHISDNIEKLKMFYCRHESKLIQLNVAVHPK